MDLSHRFFTIRNLRRRYVVGVLLFSVLLLSGCGSRTRAAAAQDAGEANAAPTSAPTPVAVADGGPRAPVAPAAFAKTTGHVQAPYRLEIPAITLETPVVELGWSTKADEAGNIFSEWNVAEFAAGWHMNSALPDQGGNVVMSGHNNIAGAVFRELDQLKKGNEVYVYMGSRRYTYLVDKVLIVPDKLATQEQREENAKWIADYDDDRLTLVSCWPRDDNTHRIIVVAHQQDSATAVTE